MRFSPGCSCCGGVGLVCDIVPCTVPSRLVATVTATECPGQFPVGAAFVFDYDPSLGCWFAPAGGTCGAGGTSYLNLVAGCVGSAFAVTILWSQTGRNCSLSVNHYMQNFLAHSSAVSCEPPYTCVSSLSGIGPAACGCAFADKITFLVEAG